MNLILSRIARYLYVRITGLTWDVVCLITAVHFALSWAALEYIGGEEIAGAEIFWYFYATTATTVGYGDYSPVTAMGRLVTVLWIMPGGIALFTTIIAKVVQLISGRWRRRMLGLANYEELTDHIVILGWSGAKTERMVEHIRGDSGEGNREIVLCAAGTLENPMPDQVRYVRAPALNTPDLLRRAAVAQAANIIVLGENDSETLAAALGAAAVNADAHMVVYFEQLSFADLLRAHCPHAECNISLEGPTQFSLTVPDDIGEIRYGSLFTTLKTQHDVTLFGMAETKLGDDLILNAPSDQRVNPGTILYFMAARRIETKDINWSTLGP